MIHCTLMITRAHLEQLGACEDGLALYDSFAAGADEVSVVWDQLAQVWTSRAYPGFASWLRDTGITPWFTLRGADLRGADLRGADLRGADLRGADLSGADLSGVWRYQSDASILGWHQRGGRLERDAK
jgi:hypothetical protein